ncbi:PREDICTED: F-box only protein 21-like isoform X1 [Trachymyrmex cornetzi]|uniref:F-box only protein 21 n=1 Tax=Trachymyrmex cornetzi TaxID=471704 RepID=A0A151JS79_9HYME|nr:PREDICTED: F-box only protein 21-like isoform X1 [Trachymyrmex cornetzi]KYN30001.1 F-box only protein 21 [Trachymyrmex cornetzi]
MTTINNLSTEVIYVILQQKIVSIEDVVNFGLTCRRFLNVVRHNNTLWQMKLYERWPHMKRIYDKRIQNEEHINFKDDVKVSIKCRNELRSHLSLMSERFFQKDNFSESDMERFDALFCPNMGAHVMNYYFLKDEMIHLITMSSLLPDCNLTHKYYSKELLLYLQQRHTKDVWQEFISYPKEQQLLEKAATIVAQWYQSQKHIFYFDVEASLDNIAQLVLERLKKVHWDHPIFSTSAEQFSFWKNNNINDNQWSKKEEKQIINMLQIVLFDELGFCGALASNLLYKLEDILIDCVLENKVGDAVSLAIIFQSVARRLGVRCDLVAFPTHFFLSWKPKSITEKYEDEEYFYIDILHGGAIVGRNDCPKTRGRRCPIENFNKHSEISPTEIVLRMICHLQMVNPNYQHYQDRTLQIRSLLEFRCMINPYDLDWIQALGRHYMQNQMSLSGLLISLQKIRDSNRISMEVIRAEELLNKFKLYMQKKMTRSSHENISPPKARCKIKYPIGMIVTNKKHVPYYTGVIIGWNKTYNSRDRLLPNSSRKLKVDMLECNSVTQPFYFILSEDGNKYYASEDSLEPCPPRWIEHNEIGRYFCRFTGSHYIPNEVLKRQYMFNELVLDRLY